jgi:3-deoxy-D-manno-octulosonic-acid transferase
MWAALYTLVLTFAIPIAVARLWWRGAREPGYRRRIGERFGRYRQAADGRPMLWLHAVSVGEARASAGLARALAARYPDHGLLLTCTTATGRATLKELHGESATIAWLPYDTPGAVRRFLEHFRPRLALLMETEIWPNLLAGCRAYGVPVMLANARMSENSARGYRRYAPLLRPAFGSLAIACAQSEADAVRLRSLGVREVEVTGNLKFDVAVDAAKQAAGRAWRVRLGRPVLLLASTREGEEAMLLGALRVTPGEAPPGLLTVVVPRHPRRFEEVAALAQARRSSGGEPRPDDRVYLGDTMGEMDFYYAAADVAVIGGGFAPLGGQNLIEACAAGVPAVLGPSMFNFAEATRLALEAGAAVQAADAAAAMREARALLSDAPLRAAMGEAGRALCAAHRGATARHLERCAALLRGPARG